MHAVGAELRLGAAGGGHLSARSRLDLGWLSASSRQTSVLALQVDGSPERAARMARVLLAIYLIAALPVAGILSLLLQRYSAVGGVGLATLGL